VCSGMGKSENESVSFEVLVRHERYITSPIGQGVVILPQPTKLRCLFIEHASELVLQQTLRCRHATGTCPDNDTSSSLGGRGRAFLV
jgi:hypothetical protein